MAAGGAWSMLGEAMAEMLDLPPPQSTSEVESIVSRVFGPGGIGGSLAGLQATPQDVIDSQRERELSDVDVATMGSDTTCTICLNQFEAGSRTIELGCNHLFHRDCILPWLSQQSTCPLCRHNIQSNGQDSGNAESSSSNRPTAQIGGLNEALLIARMLARVVAPESNTGLPADDPFNCTENPFSLYGYMPQPNQQPDEATGTYHNDGQQSTNSQPTIIPAHEFSGIPLD